MRGLKHQFRQGTTRENNVASFTDAWIETTTRRTPSGPAVSHLLQMRGLKPKLGSLTDGQIQVASFTDAWIETFTNCLVMLSILVASFTDAWIETAVTENPYGKVMGRIFYRCVD